MLGRTDGYAQGSLDWYLEQNLLVNSQENVLIKQWNGNIMRHLQLQLQCARPRQFQFNDTLPV